MVCAFEKLFEQFGGLFLWKVWQLWSFELIIAYPENIIRYIQIRKSFLEKKKKKKSLNENPYPKNLPLPIKVYIIFYFIIIYDLGLGILVGFWLRYLGFNCLGCL